MGCDSPQYICTTPYNHQPTGVLNTAQFVLNPFAIVLCKFSIALEAMARLILQLSQKKQRYWRSIANTKRLPEGTYPRIAVLQKPL
jgi:hypothetical protein